MSTVIFTGHLLGEDPHLDRSLAFLNREVLGVDRQDPAKDGPAAAGPYRKSELRTHRFSPATYREFLATVPLRYITIHEIIRAHFKTRGGVANELPPKHLWANLVPTLKLADELRRRLGQPLVEVTSAYRTADYNAQIKGAAEGSYHIQNQALDLRFGCPPAEVAATALRLREDGYFRGGIGIYPTFTHIDTRGRNADWDFS